MGSKNHEDGKSRTGESPRRARSRTLEENVETILAWERALLHQRTRAEQLSDWITGHVANSPVLPIHVIWFAGWIALNVGALGPHRSTRFRSHS